MNRTRGLCLPFVGGYEFVRVLPETKEEVLDFLKPWEVADIVFAENPALGSIYTLIHSDPDYNAVNDSTCWMWGHVGEYLTRDIGAHADQEEPLQVTPEAFAKFHIVADTGISLNITTEDLRQRQTAFDAWYEQEYGGE